MRRVRNHDIAAELVHDTFLAAFGAYDSYDPTLGTRPAWLHGIAHNVLLAWQRNHRRHLTAGLSPEAGLPTPVEHEHEHCCDEANAAIAVALDTAMAALDPQQRRAIWLHHVDERSYRDIAIELGVNPALARQYTSRGLAHLRVLLEP